MINFNKRFNIKIISVIVAITFIINGNVYPDMLSSKTLLRKHLDFNEKENLRHKCTLVAATINNKILEVRTKLPPNEIVKIAEKELRLLLANEKFSEVRYKIDREKGHIWIYHTGDVLNPDGTYIKLYTKPKSPREFSFKTAVDFDRETTASTISSNKKISLIHRIIAGGAATSLFFLAVNIMRYFVTAPNYLRPLRYAAIVVAGILVISSIVILPEVLIGRGLFKKEKKIKSALFWVIIISIIPNLFFIKHKDNNLHYIRHEIVTPILGHLYKADEFNQQQTEVTDIEKKSDIQHSIYTIDHVLGSIFKKREVVHVVLVPIGGRYKLGVEAVKGIVPFKEAFPDRIANNDPGIILKMNGGYSLWDEPGGNFWNASLVIKNGGTISEFSPNAVKRNYILTVLQNGEILIAPVEDYVNGLYPFDGSEENLSAIHGGFALMVNGRSTGFAKASGDIEQNRSWGIIFQCVDNAGKKHVGFFYSKGIIHGISGTPLSKIYRFLTETFAIEHNVTVTDIMVMESGGWSFLHATLQNDDIINEDTGEAHATSVLVIHDTSFIEKYRKVASIAMKDSKNFYDVLIGIDTAIFTSLLKMIEQESPGQVYKLAQGLTHNQLRKLLNKSISFYPFAQQRLLPLLVTSIAAGDEKAAEILERLILEREVYSTELVEISKKLGAQEAVLKVISMATENIVPYKIASYKGGAEEKLYEKEEPVKFSAQEGWGALVIELRDERKLKMPVSLYGKQIKMKIKNNSAQSVSTEIKVRTVRSQSFIDTAILKRLLLEPNAEDLLVLDEFDITKGLGEYGYDIEAFVFAIIGSGNITLEELTLVDLNTGLEIDLIHYKEGNVSQLHNAISDKIKQFSGGLSENL